MKVRLFVLLVLFAASVSFAANPQVTLQVSGAVSGTIVLEIYADTAPVTAANFINYVQSDFYNGLIFHRVVNDAAFKVIQGGGFDTELAYKTPGPKIINESSNRLSNIRGTIAMPRDYPADSATSQFFINVIDNTFLNYGAITADLYSGRPYTQVGYCVFGAVTSGMNVVDAIAALPTSTQNGMTNVPVNDVIIQSAAVTFIAPVCSEKLDGDIDGDCDVDFADFSGLAENWLQCNSITATCD